MAVGSGVLVVGEAGPEGLRPISLEVMTAGRRLAEALGEPVVALMMGHGVDGAARAFGAAGADRLVVADDAALAGLTTESATAVLATAIERLGPRIVLVPGTTAGRDYAPRLAARLGVGLAADCVEVSIDDGKLVAVRPVLGGKVLTAVALAADRLAMATIRPGSFPRSTESSAVHPESLPVSLTERDRRVTVRETAAKAAGQAALTKADVVVSGGRGLKEPANFQLVEELAAVLGGAVGATRAVVDAGWRPHHEQVGQTGVSVQPKLYIAVGVSGAVQHNVGMQASDYVVAINRDPDAPIFKIASFGIVGDLFEVVPAVIAELKSAKGG